MAMKDMLKNLNQETKNNPVAQETYAPKLPSNVMEAVEQAVNSPSPIPNLKDSVVKSFIDMGANIAKSLREAGQYCYDQGVKRKEEYDKAATVAEKKAEFQAREAGNLIDEFEQLRNLSKGGINAPPSNSVAGTTDSSNNGGSDNHDPVPSKEGHQS
jgi:hypothetical protein